jgi:hypothetical protein
MGSVRRSVRTFFSLARFEVTHVDAHEAMVVKGGDRTRAPRDLDVVHEGATAVVIEGPAPLVLAYAPAARRALTRLANLARAG